MPVEAIELGDYQPLVSPIRGQLRYDMDRRDARTMHNYTVEHIPERLDQLARLCERNGFTNDPAGWTDLLNRLEADPERPGKWKIEWSAIGYDIALAMGENLIERSNGQLHWKLYTGSKRSLSYQHTVLVGFQSIPNKHYFFDAYHSLQSFMRRRVGIERDDGLVPFLDHMAAKI